MDLQTILVLLGAFGLAYDGISTYIAIKYLGFHEGNPIGVYRIRILNTIHSALIEHLGLANTIVLTRILGYAVLFFLAYLYYLSPYPLMVMAAIEMIVVIWNTVQILLTIRN